MESPVRKTKILLVEPPLISTGILGTDDVIRLDASKENRMNESSAGPMGQTIMES
jgi:hypothetical protein